MLEILFIGLIFASFPSANFTDYFVFADTPSRSLNFTVSVSKATAGRGLVPSIIVLRPQSAFAHAFRDGSRSVPSVRQLHRGPNNLCNSCGLIENNARFVKRYH